MGNEQHTFSGYLGPKFQLKLLWQLVTEPIFSEKITPLLGPSYFDDDASKRFFISLKNYFDDNKKVAIIQNDSVNQAINKYNISDIDKEMLLGVLEQIIEWEQKVIDEPDYFDGDVVQRETFTFITQQEYRKLADFINENVRRGKTKKSEEILEQIDEKIKIIAEIGEDEDYGSGVFDDLDDTLQKDFRRPVPTGIEVIDRVTGGGLGRGEIGVLLAGTGVGKTTFLTNCAHTAQLVGVNVLHIVFEDTIKQIKRKSYAIKSNVRLSEMDDNIDLVKNRIVEFQGKYKGKLGKHIIVRFSQENTTIPKIRGWIDRYQKKYGIKFGMIVLDYIDCVESHKKSTDTNQGEINVIKAFESMAADYDIPCWTAIQANRSAYGAEWIGTGQMGGSIKRAQKTHFLMSVSKTQEQKENGYANIQILKARFAQDGQTYKDCRFDNDSLLIEVFDTEYNKKKSIKINEKDVDEFNKNISEDLKKIENSGDVDKPTQNGVFGSTDVLAEKLKSMGQ